MVKTMYFKIYANNCNAEVPIKEIKDYELEDAMAVLVGQAIDVNLVNLENVNAAYQTAKAQLEEFEILNCGDYCIVKQDDVPQLRPNMCGFDTFIFED